MSKSFLVSVTNDLNQDQRMHRICESLSEEGYEVLFLGREKPNSTPLLNQNFKQKRLKCIFSKGVLFYLEFNIRLLFFALKYKPDVFYSVDLDTIMSCGLAAKILRKTIIHDAHEYFVEVPELEGKFYKKRIWNMVGAFFIPKCDLCFSVNQELADILSQKYKNKFHVIKSVPVLSTGAEETMIENEIPVILYQGVLNKGRGLKESILAVNELKEDVVFKIAGEGDLSDELRMFVDKVDTKKRVQFLGWLTPKQLKQETQNADIGLNLLSATSLNYKYSLANKFFDYMHASVPSINMNFPVYKRICNTYEVGLCIDSLEQKPIQEAILSIISDREKVKRIKIACSLAKNKFNWNNESKVLVGLIKQYA
jgi:glycosyltransferase involved in cell wall biosynthesis